MRAFSVGVLAVSLAAVGLRPGDPVGAEALWDHAVATAPTDLTDPVYLDAARDLSRIRPWQPGFAQARLRLDAIAAARRVHVDP